MRYVFITLLFLISLLVLRINTKLYEENYTQAEKKADISLQLNFLESELKSNNLGDRMQQVFPEGYVFIHALYGLAWCELALGDDPKDQKLKDKAIAESLYAYNAINSDKARQPFTPYLRPNHGIYYFGWRNYLLSKILTLDTTFEGHEVYKNTFFKQCDTLKLILQDTKNPYLESYSMQSWPADMVVAMASLSNHDNLFQSKYKNDINAWLYKVKNSLDTNTNMIPHAVNCNTGKSIQGARGSSMSLMLRMLHEIDTSFANEQFKLFESRFISTTFGLPSIREYPTGENGVGDIDSGPVIFGVGFAATIVTTGTLSVYDQSYQAENLHKTIHAFGFATVDDNKKSYLFGTLPMADAFIAWGRATSLNHSNKITTPNSTNWRLKFHIISLISIVLLWGVCFTKTLFRFFKMRTSSQSD